VSRGRGWPRPRTLLVGAVAGAIFAAACTAGVQSDAAGDEDVEAVLAAVRAEPPAGDAPFRFVDVTEQAGLDGIQSERRENVATTMAAGAAVVDYDDDGFVDIYLTRYGLPNRLMRNNGDGTFTDVAAQAGVDAIGADGTPVFADVDGDGALDLFVTGIGASSQNRLYMNNGDGTFVDEAELRGVAPDLVSRKGDSMAHQFGAAFGDPDRDGDLDLVVLQWFGNDGALIAPRARFLRNDGAGFFSDATEEVGLEDIKTVAGFTPVFYDVDGDGWPDLLVVGDWKTSRAYRNTGSGTFEDMTEQWGVGKDKNGMGSVIADLDDDGRIDWFVTSISYPRALRPRIRDGEESFEGIGCPNGVDEIRDRAWTEKSVCTGNVLYSWNGRRFEDVTDRFGVRSGYWGWGTTAADFDLDGRPELAMTNGMEVLPNRQGALNLDDPFEEFAAAFRADPNRLWRAPEGDGPWVNVAEATGFANTADGKALLAFDMDNDGDLDVLQANTATDPILYRTDTEPGRSWLRVKLVESGGLRGAGATIEVTPVDVGGAAAGAQRRTQRRTVFVGGTYMGQEPYEQTFGLGAATRAEVTVVWADGSRQPVGIVAGNQLVEVRRG
jgi:hypothetical protein